MINFWKGQIWGHTNFWARSKFGPSNFEANSKDRPTLRPSQKGQFRPGQVLEYARFVCVLVVKKGVLQVSGNASFCDFFPQESLQVKNVFRLSAQQGKNYRESTRKGKICKKMVGKSYFKKSSVSMNNWRS